MIVGPGQLVAEQVDLGLQQALRFAGAVILGVFAEIAFGAGGGDPLFDLGHLLVLQHVELGFDLVVPGTGHGNAFRHGCASARFNLGAKKAASSGRPMPRVVFSTRSGAM